MCVGWDILGTDGRTDGRGVLVRRAHGVAKLECGFWKAVNVLLRSCRRVECTRCTRCRVRVCGGVWAGIDFGAGGERSNLHARKTACSEDVCLVPGTGWGAWVKRDADAGAGVSIESVSCDLAVRETVFGYG